MGFRLVRWRKNSCQAGLVEDRQLKKKHRCGPSAKMAPKLFLHQVQ